jgi:riboflavin-specific deaminase-like protein
MAKRRRKTIFAAASVLFLATRCIRGHSNDDAVPMRSQSSEKIHANQTIQKITTCIASWQEQHHCYQELQRTKRPFVTLTFAQSLDGKIAIQGSSDICRRSSSNLPLSGPDSKRMTHALRSMHDAILIGGKTLSIDNPRLTNRLWKTGELLLQQPLPVVLDARLEHIRRLGSRRKVGRVVVCCSHEAAAAARSRAEEEDNPSVEFLPCKCTKDNRIDLRDALEKLYNVYGIRNVMVEGGSTVLSAFSQSRLVDCLCITIAPKLIGNEYGLAAFADGHLVRESGIMPFSQFMPLGCDCIYLSRLTATSLTLYRALNQQKDRPA